MADPPRSAFRRVPIFPYKLNLFTKLVYKQIGAALQSVK